MTIAMYWVLPLCFACVYIVNPHNKPMRCDYYFRLTDGETESLKERFTHLPVSIEQGLESGLERRKDCVIPILLSCSHFQLPLGSEEVSKRIPEYSVGFGSFLLRRPWAYGSVGQSRGVWMVGILWTGCGLQ